MPHRLTFHFEIRAVRGKLRTSFTTVVLKKFYTFLGFDKRIKWTGNKLKDRIINFSFGIGSSRKAVTRDNPNGVVISPLLLNRY